MHKKEISLIASFLLVSSVANAQEAGGYTVGSGLSFFGANLELGYTIDPNWRARGAIMGGFNADFSETDEDVNVDGEFDLGGAALLADYYPTQSGWRVSGGLFFSNTELTATGTVDVGDPVVTEDATLTAKLANEVSPMITTGYDWSFADGWALTSEIGAIFGGGIDVSIVSDDPDAQAEIDADADVQELIQDASDIVAVPYLSLGLSYRF